MPDVAAGLLGQQPLVLDDLREDLLRLELAAQVGRDRPDHRLEDLGQPAVRGLLLVGQVALRPVRVQVVEQLPGLVLLGVQAGQPQQPAGVVAGVDDLGADPVAAVHRGHGHLGDVEAQLVEPADPALDVVPGVAGDLLLVRDLVPQPLVAGHDVVDDRLRVDRLVQQLGGLQVEALAEDVQPERSRGPRCAGPRTASGSRVPVSASTR